MNVLETFVDLLSRFPMQLLLAELLFCVFHSRRRYFWLTFPISAAAIFFLPQIFPSYTTSFMIGSWFSFIYIFIFLLIQAVIFLNFSLTVDQLLFYGIAAYTMQHLLYTIDLIVEFYITLSPIALNLAKNGIAVILYAICYVVFIRRFKEQDSVRVNNTYLIVFTSFVLIVVSIFSNYVMINYTFALPTAIYRIISCILILFVHFGFFEQTKLEREKEIVDQLLNNNTKQRRLSKDTIDLINIKFHDLKHEIARLGSKSNIDEEDKQALQDLHHAINVYDRSVKTGNETLDIVLTEKNLLCEKFNIEISCIADAQTLSFMSKTDIYSLFGNILDNAIESVKDAPEDQRYISLNIHTKGTMLSIHSDNYCSRKVHFVDGLPQSSKTDRAYHGYGAKSIRFIVDKYHGVLNMAQNNDLFRVDVLFPIKELQIIPPKKQFIP